MTHIHRFSVSSPAVSHIGPLGAARRRELWETSVLQLCIKPVLWQCCLHTAHWLSHCCFLTIWDAALCVTHRLFSSQKNKSIKACDLLALLCLVLIRAVVQLVIYIGILFVDFSSAFSTQSPTWNWLTVDSGLEHHILQLDIELYHKRTPV